MYIFPSDSPPPSLPRPSCDDFPLLFLSPSPFPPQLEMQEVVRGYEGSKRRLIVLGYNATLTTM